MDNLDSFDLKILSALQDDSRISMIDLAERVGLSPTPCTRRIKRLESEGYIDRYVTLLNPEKLSAGLSAFVNIRLRSQTSDAFDRFDSEIAQMPEVVGCYLLAGSFDYLLQVRVADVDAFREFMRNRLTAMQGVTETQSSIVLQQLKHTTAIPLPRNHASRR
ncbi:MAG TPA: Lrp/AsnC family transcriptional regulator [Micropepsaceae bacterium]|nr:Lrp/AsnC family transcriptional regulator [Micropepsaceae bacterium]